MTTECLGIYKALYAYTAQGEDEVSMEEDQLLFLLDNSDEDWYKVRVKPPSQEVDGPEGLVPAAYVEKPTPLSTVRAIYDYEATASGELTVSDGQVLTVYEKEDDWILVEIDSAKIKGKKECGYVPANYVEEADAEETSEQPAPTASRAPAIVIPDSPPRPTSVYVAPEERVAASHAKPGFDPVETYQVTQSDDKWKKGKKGTLGVGTGGLFFASTDSKAGVQRWQTINVAYVNIEKNKNVEIAFSNSSERLFFISKGDADAIQRKIESSRTLSGGGAQTNGHGAESPRPSTESRAIHVNRAIDVVSPPTKAVHFASHPSEIPPRPDTPEDYNEADVEEANEMYNHAGRESPIPVGGYENHPPPARAAPPKAATKVSAPRKAGFNTDDGEIAVALYDFTGDASDELSVKEGETLLVLDRSNDDWWKCRNLQGKEGVVPAQYVDLETLDGEHEEASPVAATPSSGVGNAAAAAAAAAAARAKTAKAPSPEPEPEPETDSEEEREREREERERKQREKEKKDKERRERDKREDEERRVRAEEEEREKKRAEEKKARATEKARQAKQKQEEEERERRKQEERAAKKKLHKAKSKSEDYVSEDDETTLAEEARRIQTRRMLDKDNAAQGRPVSMSSSSSQRGPPPTGKTRVWHDRTGQFRVEAEFKGVENGKIRLHKLNGVTIEVPSEKMSPEDIRFIAKITGQDIGQGRDEGRGSRSLDSVKLPSANVAADKVSSSARAVRPGDTAPKKRVDWFEFFLNAGCDMDDCTRYAQTFERDKIDETILPDLKADNLRSLGLREGDIIRVIKAVEKRQWKSKTRNEEPGVLEQIQADERYAQQVQEAIMQGKKPPPAPGPIPQPKPTSPPPNLFAGPNGALKDQTRRGRPTPSGKQTSINVDENMLANASTRLGTPTSATRSNRTPSPNLLDTGSTSSNTVAAPKPSGFDDDAWTPRPSSTNPISPAVAVTPPAAPASAPPAPPPPVVAAPTPIPSVVAPERPSTADINPRTAALEKELELLQKIAELKRAPSAPIPSSAPAAPPVPSPSIPSHLTSALSPGLSPSPGLQPQQTGFLTNGIRGPFAPVPANEPVLLKPLVPLSSQMTGFVPTRPTMTSNNLAPQPLFSQATGFQPTLGTLQTQVTGFQPSFSAFQPQMTAMQPSPSPFQPQPTGYQVNPFQPQPTGLTPLMTQATGMQFGMRATPSPIPPVPPMPNQFTSSPSMFNQQPSFGQPQIISTQPFGGPPSASPPPVNNSPANVFAAMKSGNFGGEEQSAPNYDAMRAQQGVSPLASQPTGWVPGFQYR